VGAESYLPLSYSAPSGAKILLVGLQVGPRTTLIMNTFPLNLCTALVVLYKGSRVVLFFALRFSGAQAVLSSYFFSHDPCLNDRPTSPRFPVRNVLTFPLLSTNPARVYIDRRRLPAFKNCVCDVSKKLGTPTTQSFWGSRFLSPVQRIC